MSLIETASYNMSASEGLIWCEDWIRLRSTEDMHTVDRFIFMVRLTNLSAGVCIFILGFLLSCLQEWQPDYREHWLDLSLNW